MNQEQTNITTGKQIRHLRTQLGMTQEELAGELNVTRQALSNWERDVNEPDLNMLKKICFLFGVNMDDFAKEVITKMETYEKKEKRQFNKYDIKRMENVIYTLLKLARLDAGIIQMEKAEENVSALMQDVLERFETWAEQDHKEITLSGKDDISLNCDALFEKHDG